MDYKESIVRLLEKVADEKTLSRVYKILLRAYNIQ